MRTAQMSLGPAGTAGNLEDCDSLESLWFFWTCAVRFTCCCQLVGPCGLYDNEASLSITQTPWQPGWIGRL